MAKFSAMQGMGSGGFDPGRPKPRNIVEAPEPGGFDIGQIRPRNIMSDYGNLGPMGETPGIQGGLPPLSVPSYAPDDPTIDYQARMNRFYTPETRATDQFNQLLNERPELNTPGIGSKIVASMAGWKGGPEAADRIMYAPYMRDMADWKSKVDPYAKAAELERSNNVNERTLAGQMITSEDNNRRIAETERYNKERNRIADENAESTRIRIEAYDFKQRHPDWKINFDGPNVIAVSPDGTQSTSLGPTGKMNERDKINLQTEGKLKVVEAAGEQARQTKGTVPGGKGGTANPQARNARFQDAYDRIPGGTKWLEKPATVNSAWQFKARPTGSLYDTLTGGKSLKAEQDEFDAVYKAVMGVPHPQSAEAKGGGIGGGESKVEKNQPIGGSGKVPSTATKPVTKSEEFQPREEYAKRSDIPFEGPIQSETPWIVDKAKRIIGDRSEGKSSGSVYDKQVMTPEGPRTLPSIPPGKMRVTDKNGVKGLVDASLTDKELAAEGYTRVK